MTKEEYLKKYGGRASGSTLSGSIPSTTDEKLESIFGVKATIEPTINDQYAYGQSMEPEVQQRPVTLTPPKQIDQDASSLDYAKNQGTVLPSYNPIEAKKAAVETEPSWKKIGREMFGSIPGLPNPFGEKSVVQKGLDPVLNSEPVISSLKKLNDATSLSSYFSSLQPREGESIGMKTAKSLPQGFADVGMAVLLTGITRNPVAGMTYFGLRSAGGQATEGGVSTEKVAIDTVGDSLIGGFIAKTLKLPANLIKKEMEGVIRKGVRGFLAKYMPSITRTGEAGLIEGGTEPTQDVLKFASDYKNAKTQQEKDAILEQAKNYFKNGDFAVAAFSGAIVGSGIEGGALSLRNIQNNKQAAIDRTRLSGPQSMLQLPAGQERVMITPDTSQRPTIYQPERVGLKQLPGGALRGDVVNTPMNAGFSMRESMPSTVNKKGKIIKGKLSDTAIYGPLVEAGDFNKIVETVNEIKENQVKIEKELVKQGETSASAKQIINTAVAELKSNDTIQNGTTQQTEQSSGLSKIAETGVVKSISTRPQIVKGTVVDQYESGSGTSYAEPVETYKGVKIVKIGNNFAVINKNQTPFFVGLDDSKSLGNRVFNKGSNNLETARRYIDSLRTNIVEKRIKTTPGTLVKLPDTTPRSKPTTQETDVIKTKEQLDEERARERAAGVNRLKELQKKASEKLKREIEGKKEIKSEAKVISEEKEPTVEERAQSLYMAYQKEVEKLDGDLDKAMGIASAYEELTGHAIEGPEEYIPTTIDKASTNRSSVTSEKDLQKMLDEMDSERGRQKRDMSVLYRRFKGKPKVKPQIGKESNIRSTEYKLFIEDINNGKRSFGIANEILNIARKFNIRLMKNIPGTEGHAIKNFIGLDSLNNPVTFAHEAVHAIMSKNSRISSKVLMEDELSKEAKQAYVRYSPGAIDNIAEITIGDVTNEGTAEFMARSLFDPSSAAAEFPNLTRVLLKGDTEEVGILQLRSLFTDVNNLLYTYQNINEDAQMIAKQVNDIDTKKKSYGSIILGRVGTKITNYLNSRHIFGVVDGLDGLAVSNNNFAYDVHGGSLNMRASTYRKSMKIASGTFDEGAEGTYMLSKDGEKIEQRLSFSMGDWLRSIFDNESRARRFGVYLSSLDSQRDRAILVDAETKLRDLKLELDFTDKKTSIEKINKSIIKVKEQIEELTARNESKATTDAEEKGFILRNKEEFGEDIKKFEEIVNLHTDLQTESGVLSKKSAEEGKSRPGYSQQFKYMVDELEGYRGNEKRSSQVSTSKKRNPSSKPVINPALTISRVYVENVKKYYAQLFYNDLYISGKDNGYVMDMGEGTANEPGIYIYAKDGVTKRFKVLDETLVSAIEADFGSQEIKNPVTKAWFNWALKYPTRFSQKMTTSLSPYFVFGKNITIDIPTSYILSQTGYKPLYSQLQRKLGSGMYKGKAEEIKGYMEEYAMFNDAQISVNELGYDGMNPYGVADKLLKRKSRYSNVYGGFLDVMSSTETMVRQEEYIRSRLLGNGVAEASEKADNISLNYGQRGVRMKFANQAVMFLNSSTRAMYQTLGALGNKDMAKRLGVTIIATSVLQVAAIAKMLNDVGNADDDDEREKALQKIYEYLDKSTYEKNAYIPLPGGYKLPSNSFLSWPGTLIGHLMIEDYLGITTDKKGVVIGGLASIIPGQIMPDFLSGNPIASAGGKIFGSTVAGNMIMNIMGYKSFPEFKEIEGKAMQYKATSERFNQNTNRLGILLGQLVKDIPGLKEISPVEFEAALRSGTGSMGASLEDIAGDLMISDEEKAGLNIDEKTWKELLVSNPLKSSFVQSPTVLTGELISPIYKERDKFDSEKQNIISDYNKLLRSSGIENPKKIEDVTPGWLSQRIHGQDLQRAKDLLKSRKDVIKRSSDVNKITDAIITAKQYKGDLPASYTNSIYRYAVLLKEGKLNELSRGDNQRLIEMEKEYDRLGDGTPKKNWRYK